MNSTITDSVSAIAIPVAAPQDDSARCQHLYPNGRRCRLRSSQADLCSRHLLQSRMAKALAAPAPSDFEDLSAELLPESSEFSSAADVGQFLARLLVQVVKGRIGSRRASVLAFISSQLLHSHRAVQNEYGSQPQQILFDLPRPKLE
jgi:hypothetical protein